MKLLYKPLGMVLGILAGTLGRKTFERVWALIDADAPPEATAQHASWGKVLTAAALQAVIFAVVRAAVERAGATLFQDFTGAWPGSKRKDPTDAA